MKRFSKNFVKYETGTDVASQFAEIRSQDSEEQVQQKYCYAENIQSISIYDQDRWFNQPDMASMLEDNGRHLYFDLRTYFKIAVDPYAIPTQEDWFNADKPIFRHNFNCDLPIVTLRYYPESEVITTTGNSQLVDVREYLPRTGSLIVFKNGRKMSPGEYEEISTTRIKFFELIQPSDSLSIQYGLATLTESEHYDVINRNIIRFVDNNIFTTFDVYDMHVWGMRTNKEALNPMQLVDKKAKIDIRNIQHWHPAYGYHFVEPYKNIDLNLPDNPATYTQSTVAIAGVGFQPWGDERVGTMWLDSSNLKYKTYHDEKAFPDCEDRIRQWGQPADWAEYPIYEWVESNVHPEEWDKLAVDEEIDFTIEESKRKSGIVWFPYFEFVNEQPVEFKTRYEEFDALIDGTVDGEGNYSFITSLRNDLIEIDESYERMGVINVYINGVLAMEDIVPPDSGIVEVPEVKISDTVTFVRIPTDDEEVIKVLMDEEYLIQEYQYSEFTKYDEIGNAKTYYYFWVHNKKTKPNIEDKTMPAAFVEQILFDSDEPYCFFGNPTGPSQIVYDYNTIDLPWRMKSFVVRGLRGLIDADRRYVIRFTRDFTLRDSLDHTLYETKEQKFNEITVPAVSSVRSSNLVYITDTFTDADGTYLEEHLSDDVKNWNVDSTVPPSGSPLAETLPKILNNAVVSENLEPSWAWVSAQSDVQIKGKIKVPSQLWNVTSVAFPVRWSGEVDAFNEPVTPTSAAFGVEFEGGTAPFETRCLLFDDTGMSILGNNLHVLEDDIVELDVKMIGTELEGTFTLPRNGYVQSFKRTVTADNTYINGGFWISGNDVAMPAIDEITVQSPDIPQLPVILCFEDNLSDANETYLYEHTSTSDHTWTTDYGSLTIRGNRLHWDTDSQAYFQMLNKDMSLDAFFSGGFSGTKETRIKFRNESSDGPDIVFSWENGQVNVQYYHLSTGLQDMTGGLVSITNRLDFRSVIEADELKFDITIDNNQRITGTITDTNMNVDSGVVKIYGTSGTMPLESIKVCRYPLGADDAGSSGCEAEAREPAKGMELKNLHEEWTLQRQEQKSLILRYLWDKVTESIIGKLLTNRNIVVPTYDREIYDITYETDTRIGLEDGQVFCDGELAEKTILAYLTDKNNDFYPTDINTFFSEHSFDTENGIVSAMDAIYSNFPYEHVNRMFFEVLHDALSLKKKYPGIIKTSMISLHSIILLDDQGKFDD